MTTIYLGRLTVFKDIVKLDSETGLIEHLSLADVPSARTMLSGEYEIVDGQFVAYYTHPLTQSCHFRVSSLDIELAEETSIALRVSEAGAAKFSVQQPDGTISSHTYQPPVLDKWDKIAIDMGDAEEESFDIFLLFSNIWNDPERRRILLGRKIGNQ